MKLIKKIYFLSFIMICLTGCTVKYNFEINNNVIDETISLTETIDKVDQKSVEEQLQYAFSQYNGKNINKYGVSKKKDSKNITYNLSQRYILSTAIYIRTFSECFDAYNLVYTDDDKTSYLLETSKGFKCIDYSYFHPDSVDINIKTNHKVLNNNADEVNDNVYTWHIDRNNFEDKYITFEFKNDGTNEEEIETTENKKSYKTLIIIIAGIIGLILLILLRVLYVNKQRNRL